MGSKNGREFRAASLRRWRPRSLSCSSSPSVRPLHVFGSADELAVDVFFPIAAMLHFGDPDWYDEYVGPLRAYYTQADKKQVSHPIDSIGPRFPVLEPRAHLHAITGGTAANPRRAPIGIGTTTRRAIDQAGSTTRGGRCWAQGRRRGRRGRQGEARGERCARHARAEQRGEMSLSRGRGRTDIGR